MKRFSFSALFLAILFLASCNSSQNSTNSADSSLIALKSPSSNSLFLSIVDQVEQDTAYLFKVSATHGDDTVGFNILMNKAIAAGIHIDGTVNEVDGFKTGNLQFIRSGQESDRFIQALAEIWSMTLDRPVFSAEPVSPLVFSSNKEAVDYSQPSTSNFKLFFHPDSTEPGELFFTHDTYYRRVELQEKDAVYRQQILQALSGGN